MTSNCPPGSRGLDKLILAERFQSAPEVQPYPSRPAARKRTMWPGRAGGGLLSGILSSSRAGTCLLLTLHPGGFGFDDAL